MNIQRLYYFLDLIETGNYTETAERLQTTQGNVSKQIKSLEKEMDAILFQRSPHKVSLTAEGQRMVSYAENIIKTYEDMKKEIKNVSISENITIKLAVISGISQYHVTDYFDGFHQKYPQFELQISEMDSGKIPEELEQENFDIGFFRTSQVDEDRYEKLVYEKDQLVAVVPTSYPLSYLKKIRLSDLSQENFLQLNDDMVYQSFLKICRRSGIAPNISYKSSSVDRIIDMVAQGMGVSVLMKSSVDTLKNPRVRAIDLSEEIKSELVFIRLRKKVYPEPAQALWAFLNRVHEGKIEEQMRL